MLLLSKDQCRCYFLGAAPVCLTKCIMHQLNAVTPTVITIFTALNQLLMQIKDRDFASRLSQQSYLHNNIILCPTSIRKVSFKFNFNAHPHCSTILGRILSIFHLFSLLFLSEQNETKHDSSSSPGMTDQEKEVAASAYEAFLVIHLSLLRKSIQRFYLVSVCSEALKTVQQ